MIRSKIAIAVMATFAASIASASFAEGDVKKGEKVFRKCKACHVADKEKNKVGPHLMGVIGRTPGTVEDFKYSKAMIAYGEENEWDEETLSKYLAAPKKVVKGTKMAFAGLKKEDQIEDVIAYIKSVAE